MIRNRIAGTRLAGTSLMAGFSLFASVFVAGITCAPAAMADSAIVKCVGSDGSVTLTDTLCETGERSVTLLAAPATAPATVHANPARLSVAAPPSVVRTVAMVHARLPARLTHPALRRFDPPSRSLARDVLTLKAARQAMILMDGAASAMRNTRVAGLN